MNTTGIILAAGKGTRMRSDIPKVLHYFRGKPFVRSILETAHSVMGSVVVVVGFRGDDVVGVLPEGVLVARQENQLGTGDAVRAALAVVPQETDIVLVMPGDLPQLEASTLEHLLRVHKAQSFPITFATVIAPDFLDWRIAFERGGRIVRDPDGRVLRIVEYKDATENERAITEVNVSIYAFKASWLRQYISKIENNNAAGEIYLTDLIAIAVAEAGGVTAVPILDIRQGAGVNSPEELHLLEQLHAVEE